MNPLILQVDGFGKHFQLHEQGKLIPSSYDVSFSVRSGQLTALIGPTGAGKSSVLKGIYRSYLPSAGRILYRNAMGHELDLALASEHQILELRRREIAFVTQFLHCLPRQSTLDVVAQPLFSLGVSRDESRRRAAELLFAMNLPERLWSVSPATFSGGERQRVNLARGFIAKPRLLLLDEPTASLDPKTAECVISLIDGLKFEGTAMLAIFHNPETTRRLADQVVELAMPPAVEDILKEIA
ncbi:MAG: phosphonate C-P lyase system protein PhnL [Propionivibrio sp.]|nr:phosphonate C-P lyase system protein PhnL [Propionivibrio sp.]MBK7564826.1 phosphonate C-P lyase system protein PhnL [Propionivibrio sp.]